MMIMDEVCYFPVRPEEGHAYLHVPQAHYAVAMGSTREITILSTRVLDHVAVALVGPEDNKGLRKIVLGHIDDGGTPVVSVHEMLKPFGAQPKDVQAFVVSGDNHPLILGPVLGALERTGIPVMQDIRDSEFVSFAIELSTGFPVEQGSLADLPKYVPGRDQEAVFSQHINGSRERYVKSGLTLGPMALAYDLRKGTPVGHEKTKPPVKAATTHAEPQ
jgi:hypothetical protein